MKTDTIKISFVTSIIFHSIILYFIASYLSSVKDVVMDITPIEILNIEEKIVDEPKMEDAPPPPLEQPIQKIKEDIPPKIEPIKHEINNVVEAPPLPSPIEKEIQEVKIEAPPPPIEETIEKPTQETIVAESTELPSNEMALQSETKISDAAETASLKTEGDAVPAEQPKTTASKPVVSGANPYGVAGGTGSGNGEEMSMFRAMVRTKIERSKFYPRWARERGFEGVVGVRFTLLPDGGVTDVKVVRPCHCEVLNKAACEAIMKAAPFNPRPLDIADKEMAMEIDISYRLD